MLAVFLTLLQWSGLIQKAKTLIGSLTSKVIQVNVRNSDGLPNYLYFLFVCFCFVWGVFFFIIVIIILLLLLLFFFFFFFFFGGGGGGVLFFKIR